MINTTDTRGDLKFSSQELYKRNSETREFKNFQKIRQVINKNSDPAYRKDYSNISSLRTTFAAALINTLRNICFYTEEEHRLLITEHKNDALNITYHNFNTFRLQDVSVLSNKSVQVYTTIDDKDTDYSNLPSEILQNVDLSIEKTDYIKELEQVLNEKDYNTPQQHTAIFRQNVKNHGLIIFTKKLTIPHINNIFIIIIKHLKEKLNFLIPEFTNTLIESYLSQKPEETKTENLFINYLKDKKILKTTEELIKDLAVKDIDKTKSKLERNRINYLEEAQRTEDLLVRTYRELKDTNLKLTGLQMIDTSETGQKLYSFLEKFKTATLLKIDSSLAIVVEAHGPADMIDEKRAEAVLSTSYWRGAHPYLTKWLINRDRFKLHLSTIFLYDTIIGSYPILFKRRGNDGTSLDSFTHTYMPNPHTFHYGCLGNADTALNKAIGNIDLEQIITLLAVNNKIVNFEDSTVMDTWEGRLDKNIKTLLDTKTNEMISFEELKNMKRIN